MTDDRTKSAPQDERQNVAENVRDDIQGERGGPIDQVERGEAPAASSEDHGTAQGKPANEHELPKGSN